MKTSSIAIPKHELMNVTRNVAQQGHPLLYHRGAESERGLGERSKLDISDDEVDEIEIERMLANKVAYVEAGVRRASTLMRENPTVTSAQRVWSSGQ
jgi:hypothetical protein